ILHSSLPLVGCTKTPPSHLHPSISELNKYMDEYYSLSCLHTQERAVEEVKLAIKPYYQRKDINKDEYKDILRKAVHKICHSRTGEINPVKVSNLVKLYVQRYKYFRKHGRKMDEEERDDRESGTLHSSA
uniref:SFR19-like C-terminal domain-containing protein n=1 Tax=Sphaeramia orbicularis TaxID=375764 RepID=A0A673AXR9_9TELE